MKQIYNSQDLHNCKTVREVRTILGREERSDSVSEMTGLPGKTVLVTEASLHAASGGGSGRHNVDLIGAQASEF